MIYNNPVIAIIGARQYASYHDFPLFPLQGSKRVVMVDNLSRFAEYIETSELNLPSSTVAFEEEGKVSHGTVILLITVT